MAYDRMDWHSGGDYPADLPEENGGNHIGMFLAWAFGRGMAGEDHREESAALLKRLNQRLITGLDFLMEACDGKFWEEDLNEQGNAFVIDYYDADSAFAAQYGSYLTDYCEVFNRYADERGTEYPSMYHVENTWDNFDRLKPVLDERFAQWQAWSAVPTNRQLDPKTQLVQACERIGQQILQPKGFKPNKAGTTWKQTAADKDMVFELSFVPERYNTRLDVRMTVSIRITSKTVKKWLAERTGRGEDTVLYGSLRRPGKAGSIVWQLAGSHLEESLQQIDQLLQERVFPLFELFADRPRVLEQLANEGAGFVGVCDIEPTPLAFLLACGTADQAQRFFAHYVSSRPSPWRRNIHQTFKRLSEGETWDYSAYHHESTIKLAFANGLHVLSQV